MKVISVPIDQIHFYEENPRTMSDDQFIKLKKSIKKFGFLEPLILNTRENECFTSDESGLTVLGGNMRLKATKQMEYEELPAVKVNLDRNEERVLNIALNRISGKWDIVKLEKMVYEISDKDLNIDLELTGLEDWEQRLYNPAESGLDEDIEDIESIIGVSEKKTYVLTLVFDKEEECLRASQFLTGKKFFSKLIKGEKLLAKIGEYEAKKD